jgi:hypothetical protein
MDAVDTGKQINAGIASRSCLSEVTHNPLGPPVVSPIRVNRQPPSTPIYHDGVHLSHPPPAAQANAGGPYLDKASPDRDKGVIAQLVHWKGSSGGT